MTARPHALLTTVARWTETPAATVTTGRLPNGWHVSLGEDTPGSFAVKVYAPGSYDRGDDPVTTDEHLTARQAADLVGATLDHQPDPRHLEPLDLVALERAVYAAHPAAD